MSLQKSNIRSFALTLLVFGFLFLLGNLGILDKLPAGLNNFIMSAKMLFIIAGIIFISSQPRTLLGWIFIIVGILLILASIFDGTFIGKYSFLYTPIGLLCGGITLLFSRK